MLLIKCKGACAMEMRELTSADAATVFAHDTYCVRNGWIAQLDSAPVSRECTAGGPSEANRIVAREVTGP
jgi:hypothetical protein